MTAAPRKPDSRPSVAGDRQEAIRRRAEEIYVRNGKIPGRDLENWAQAEQEILRESAPRRTAIIVKVNGAEYVGEYDPDFLRGLRARRVRARTSQCRSAFAATRCS